MEGGPLLTDWWVSDSKDFVLYLNITSRVDSHPDQGMLQAKGGGGFPYVVFMDAEGEVLTAFRPTDKDALAKAAASAKDFAALKARVKKDPADKNAKAQLLMAQLRMKDSKELRAELAQIMEGKLDAKTTEAYKGFESREKIMTFMKDLQGEMRGVAKEDRETKAAEVQAKALAKWKEGLVPPEPSTEYISYLLFVTQGAIKAGDKAAAEAALKPLNEIAKGIEQLRDMVKKLEGEVSKL